MPIVFKGLTGPELIDLLEIHDDMKWWIGSSGLKVTVYASEVRFTGQDISAAIPVKLDHLSQLKQGTLGDLAKKALRMSVVGAIKQLKKKLDPDASPPASFSFEAPPAKLPDTPSGGIMAALAKNKPKPPFPGPATPPASAPAPPGAWPEFPAGDLKHAAPVALCTATQMYQPVRGSSSNSRYFLVAANGELRIACRYNAGALSIRIEGPGYAKNKPRLVACGFTGVNADYASMHLQVEDSITASKALGAVLMGLGVKLDTPLPDLQLLYGKGS